jgi:hypothetical protein
LKEGVEFAENEAAGEISFTFSHARFHVAVFSREATVWVERFSVDSLATEAEIEGDAVL